MQGIKSTPLKLNSRRKLSNKKRVLGKKLFDDTDTTDNELSEISSSAESLFYRPLNSPLSPLVTGQNPADQSPLGNSSHEVHVTPSPSPSQPQSNPNNILETSTLPTNESTTATNIVHDTVPTPSPSTSQSGSNPLNILETSNPPINEPTATKIVHNSAGPDPTSYLSITWLRSLLVQSFEGRMLLQYYDKNKRLPDKKRKILNKIIISNELREDASKKISSFRLECLSNVITKVFPTEQAETYFIPYSRTHSVKLRCRGMLYEKYTNTRKDLLKEKLILGRSRFPDSDDDENSLYRTITFFLQTLIFIEILHSGTRLLYSRTPHF